jgi:hypothetical protein
MARHEDVIGMMRAGNSGRRHQPSSITPSPGMMRHPPTSAAFALRLTTADDVVLRHVIGADDTADDG